MTNVDVSHFDAGTRIQTFNQENSAQLATIDGYSDEEADLNDAIAKLKDASDTQAQDNKGLATDKDALRKAMAEIIVMYSHRGVVKASRAGNAELEKGLDHAARYYLETPADIAINRANATVKLISDNLALITSVSVANVAAMQAAVTAFANSKDAPVAAVKTKKALGTNQIAALLAKVDKAIAHMSYLVHSYFPGSTLASNFDEQAKLVTVGVHHNTVVIHFEDAATGAPITKGVATETGMEKTAETDETGAATFASVRSGKQEFTAAADGYTLQNIIIKVKRGTHTEVVMKMAATSGGGTTTTTGTK